MLEVKIKPDKYGNAIGMLLRMGEGFQTRYKCSLIVTARQRRILEDAGFIATNGSVSSARKARGIKIKE